LTSCLVSFILSLRSTPVLFFSTYFRAVTCRWNTDPLRCRLSLSLPRRSFPFSISLFPFSSFIFPGLLRRRGSHSESTLSKYHKLLSSLMGSLFHPFLFLPRISFLSSSFPCFLSSRPAHLFLLPGGFSSAHYVQSQFVGFSFLFPPNPLSFLPAASYVR